MSLFCLGRCWSEGFGRLKWIQPVELRIPPGGQAWTPSPGDSSIETVDKREMITCEVEPWASWYREMLEALCDKWGILRNRCLTVWCHQFSHGCDWKTQLILYTVGEMTRQRGATSLQGWLEDHLWSSSPSALSAFSAFSVLWFRGSGSFCTCCCQTWFQTKCCHKML